MQTSTIVGPDTDLGGLYQDDRSQLQQRSSIEDPRVSIHEFARALESGATAPTGTGADYLPVSPEGAMRVTTVMACINWLGNQLLKVPFHVYRPGSLGKERVRDHPAARILARRPNPFQTRGSFQQTLAVNAFRTGRGVAELVRAVDGRVVEMFPLVPERLTVELRNGELTYKYTVPGDKGSTTYEMERYDVLDIPGLSLDGITTLNPISYLRAKLSETLRRDALSDNMQRKGFPAGGLAITHPKKKLDPQQKTTMGRAFGSQFGGAANVGEIPILDEGMGVTQLPRMTMIDAQWIESSKLTKLDICVALNVPPQALGLVDAKYNNLEMMTQVALDNCADPWLVKFEEALTESLLTEEEIDAGWVIEAQRNRLVAMDGVTRTQLYRTYLEMGVMNADQVADRENLSRLPDERGTVYMQPVNAQPKPTPKEAQQMLAAIIASKSRTGGDGKAGGDGASGSDAAGDAGTGKSAASKDDSEDADTSAV